MRTLLFLHPPFNLYLHPPGPFRKQVFAVGIIYKAQVQNIKIAHWLNHHLCEKQIADSPRRN